jgi:hypothetical protein
MSRRGRESLYSKGTTEKFHRRDWREAACLLAFWFQTPIAPN